MSHFSRIRTKITDLEALSQALQELGFEVVNRVSDAHLTVQGVESTAHLLTVQGVGSTARNASLVARGEFEVLYRYSSTTTRSTTTREFGFVQTEDGFYELHIDPYMINNHRPDFIQNFTGQINQRYAAVVAKRSLEAQGFILSEETDENGEIHMILVRC